MPCRVIVWSNSSLWGALKTASADMPFVAKNEVKYLKLTGTNPYFTCPPMFLPSNFILMYNRFSKSSYAGITSG